MSVFPTNDEFHEGKELLVLLITVAPELRKHLVKNLWRERMDG